MAFQVENCKVCDESNLRCRTCGDGYHPVDSEHCEGKENLNVCFE